MPPSMTAHSPAIQPTCCPCCIPTQQFGLNLVHVPPLLMAVLFVLICEQLGLHADYAAPGLFITITVCPHNSPVEPFWHPHVVHLNHSHKSNKGHDVNPSAFRIEALWL